MSIKIICLYIKLKFTTDNFSKKNLLFSSIKQLDNKYFNLLKLKKVVRSI